VLSWSQSYKWKEGQGGQAALPKNDPEGTHTAGGMGLAGASPGARKGADTSLFPADPSLCTACPPISFSFCTWPPAMSLTHR
jgi:hypothetical protein